MKAPLRLTCPEGEHVWDWFLDIFDPNSGGGFASSIVSYAEIEAYERRNGHRLYLWEVRLIRELCREYNVYLAEKAKKSTPTAPKTTTNPGAPQITRVISMNDAQGLRSLFS